jgi:hypothetical protein
MSTRSNGRRKRSGAQRRADKARNKARRDRNGKTAEIVQKQENQAELKQAMEKYKEKLKNKIVWT